MPWKHAIKRLRTVLKTSKLGDHANINKNLSLSRLPKQITIEEILEYGEQLNNSQSTDEIEL